METLAGKILWAGEAYEAPSRSSPVVFGNLIHPGRTVRLSQKCNRGTALGAVAALELLVADFS